MFLYNPTKILRKFNNSYIFRNYFPPFFKFNLSLSLLPPASSICLTSFLICLHIFINYYCLLFFIIFFYYKHYYIFFNYYLFFFYINIYIYLHISLTNKTFYDEKRKKYLSKKSKLHIKNLILYYYINIKYIEIIIIICKIVLLHQQHKYKHTFNWKWKTI